MTPVEQQSGTKSEPQPCLCTQIPISLALHQQQMHSLDVPTELADKLLKITIKQQSFLKCKAHTAPGKPGLTLQCHCKVLCRRRLHGATCGESLQRWMLSHQRSDCRDSDPSCLRGLGNPLVGTFKTGPDCWKLLPEENRSQCRGTERPGQAPTPGLLAMSPHSPH